ncbi:MAG: di-heme-cytochrome C peroxidase [Hyphomicrobiales bacterium]
MFFHSVLARAALVKPAISACCFFGLTATVFAQVVTVNQGGDWTSETRAAFYTQDQGSRIMPLAWMRALKLADGTAFLKDSLSRYGYLPNPENDEPDIPVGFTVANMDGVPSIGMTCSACHTRQIDVNGTAYRIDGGPGIVDFQSFLADLDSSSQSVLATESSYDQFADEVLGAGASSTKKAELKLEVETWVLRFHTLIEGSLPDPAWGPSRLDAVSMIFNRIAGLDIGEPPTYLIRDNIQTADAPTRYPFLWNAAVQDKTQWPGFSDNGNSLLGLSRNLGEVYGVFAVFHPQKQSGILKLNRDYLTVNSANFSGLGTVEDLIWKIGPPQWPWQFERGLASVGKGIYERPTDQGGCAECHGIKKGAFRSPFHSTWATPIMDVGTDRRECEILQRTVDTGIMNGAKVPFADALKPKDKAFNLLATSVIGSIIQHGLGNLSQQDVALMREGNSSQLPSQFDDLKGAFRQPQFQLESFVSAAASAGKSGCAYESRVMEGIWAAAPYLHNGSVPTLEDLLKPASERPTLFKLGPNYDIEAVGMAAEQSKFDYTLTTTDCSDVASGNSRCGHEFGTSLSDSEKKALLEYLKVL